MMHELGSSILWQRPKPSRTHDIAMSPKRGMCTPHTICRALEPSVVRLSATLVHLQTPTCSASSLWFTVSCDSMPAKASVCCQTTRLSRAGCMCRWFPSRLCTRGAAWDDRSLDSQFIRRCSESAALDGASPSSLLAASRAPRSFCGVAPL